MMALIYFFALASCLLGQVVAQSDSPRVWAAVAFVNHGETTPQLGPLETILTPEGAQQLFRQGSAFRSRYLSINSKGSGLNVAPIRNISQDAIDNVQVTAVSQAEEWVVAGATAFFQALYPANPANYNDKAGGMDVARDYPEGDNITDYPLNGYQYANIQTFSMLDKQYPSLQGTTNCRARGAEIGSNLIDTEDMRQSFTGSLPFYKQLFDSGPLEGFIDADYADYWKAYEIYELVNYMYTHNVTVFSDLDRANDTLATLEANALEFETALTSPHSENKDDETDALYTIAGRTLAAKIEAQFLANIARDGQQNKLTMMFGSHIPLMSFFHIANLKSGTSKESDPFSKLPQPGAAMVFELISDTEFDQYDMPSRDNLRVRFLYRASADQDEEFKAASLFGSSSAEQGLPWSDFSRLMVDVGVSSDEWCSICQPENAAWCNTTDAAVGNGDLSADGGLDPAVAGVIGAAVTLALTAMLGLALFFIFGFRLHRARKDDSTTVIGGFKGTDRMPDDKDVAISKGGARHERVGSWELRDGPSTPPAFNGAGILTSDFHRHNDSKDEDDAISVTGARVVNTRESV